MVIFLYTTLISTSKLLKEINLAGGYLLSKLNSCLTTKGLFMFFGGKTIGEVSIIKERGAKKHYIYIYIYNGRSSLKCYYNQILDLHFFTFSYTTGLSKISCQISIYYEKIDLSSPQ